ncbi:hypothetical protein QQY24_30320 [Streptomyces sp. TG1A-8]|uniref:hypothetical protein n=1 Tax=Streptomyces sp. TG1A-8 TaxID=3051385 RepID=UPI00265C6AB0|nr:hypothetical protein [Streptomyces sp. TG1A-8]MDO0929492.1 hypothetical protein [Streptomyces sp. TG1A-8]
MAQTAARHWIAHGPDDLPPLPIPSDYRHSVELSLKRLIRKAAPRAPRGGRAGEEDLGPGQWDKRLRTHDIRKLSDRLDQHLAPLDPSEAERRIDPESRSQPNRPAPGRAQSEKVRAPAADVKKAQAPEIETLSERLTSRGGTVPAGGAMSRLLDKSGPFPRRGRTRTARPRREPGAARHFVQVPEPRNTPRGYTVHGCGAR